MNKEQFKTLKSGQSVALILKVKNKNDFDQTIWTDVPGQAMWLPKERLQPVGLHLMEEVLVNMPEWYRLIFRMLLLYALTSIRKPHYLRKRLFLLLCVSGAL